MEMRLLQIIKKNRIMNNKSLQIPICLHAGSRRDRQRESGPKYHNPRMHLLLLQLLLFAYTRMSISSLLTPRSAKTTGYQVVSRGPLGFYIRLLSRRV